jgi:hypothetical protein
MIPARTNFRNAQARRIRSSMDYDLTEWIDHGAPDTATREEIVNLMESFIEGDAAGLAVRREGDGVRFTHQTAAFVLEHGADR